MIRRKLFLKTFAGAFVACDAFSQVLPQDQPLRPYLQVKPVAGDERIVRVFVSPGCPFSKMYLQFFRNLAATLPTGKTLIYTPLVNRADGVAYAMGFAAVQRYHPALLDNFIEASMVASQDKGIATSTWPGLERIGKASGLPVSLPKLVSASKVEVMADVERYVSLRHNLQVLNTPAVSVAGTYVVNPEFTKGDAALFSQLVNGIVSMAR